MEVQPGDDLARALLALTTERAPENRAVCYLTYTNGGDPPDHPGQPGPHAPCTPASSRASAPGTARPSRTKVVRFADKPRHQLFIEPMGLDTEELYVQGFSSSMPEEVQIADAATPCRVWSTRR